MQKELLDTELDLYKKMQAGEEVTELRRKYTELQLEVCLCFFCSNYLLIKYFPLRLLLCILYHELFYPECTIKLHVDGDI